MDSAFASQYGRVLRMVQSCLARTSRRAPEELTEPATGLAHELYLDLVGQRQPFRDAEHFMAVASIRCLHVVVDYLRQRGRAKRGGGDRGGPLPEDLAARPADPASWLLRDGVSEALTRFAEEFPRHAQVLTLRVFFEHTTREVADLLDLSTATVERDLRASRAYLRAVMADDAHGGA